MRIHRQGLRTRSRSSRGGFTLIEVMVTLAIMSLVMLGLMVSLQATIFTHDDVQVDIAQVREGPRILDMVERDLRALHCYNIKDRSFLRGERQFHIGNRGDRLDFLTDVDSSQRLYDPTSEYDDPRMIASDFCEVGYRLRERADSDTFMELYRREDLYVDENPLEGGRYELVHDKVAWFEINYLTELGPKGERIDEWNLEERGALPAAVEIRIELQSHPQMVGDFVELEGLSSRIYEYTRIVPLDPTFNLAMGVRPARPTTIDPNDVGGVGGGGGGGGGGGPMDGQPGSPGAPGTSGEFGGPGGPPGGPGAPGGGGGGSTLIDYDGGEGGGRQIRNGLFNGGNGLDDLTNEENEQLDDLLDEYRKRYGG